MKLEPIVFEDAESPDKTHTYKKISDSIILGLAPRYTEGPIALAGQLYNFFARANNDPPNSRRNILTIHEVNRRERHFIIERRALGREDMSRLGFPVNDSNFVTILRPRSETP